MRRRTLREKAARQLQAAAARLDGTRRPDRDPQLEADRSGTYPAPYPTGWYVLARAQDVRRAPRYVRALGEHFVLFRTATGRIGVLDAHCPHLGANLAGGEVKGECIECPFHGWTFATDGRVVGIPYAQRVPPSLATRAWAVDERAGLVCVYYDADQLDGRGRPEPPYALPRHDVVERGEMVLRGDHDAGIVRMHVAEFAENSADMAHFPVLHGDMFLPWSGFKVPGLRLHHRARWSRDPDADHTTWFHDEVEIEVLGRRIPRTRGRADICMAGPGGVITFDFAIPDVGRVLMYQTHTPVTPVAQQVRFRWFAERRVPRILVWYVVGNWISQWREDIAIWEHKVHRRRPMLVPGDGPILAMRRWYARFYPDGGAR
ncbi:MAG: Rieske 2Fe-2S domain-containing protein [Myxococcota bacterium]